MPLLNYTTQIDVNKSVAEISKNLVAHGATRIAIEYGIGRIPTGLAFTLMTAYGDRLFRLPANIAGVERALKAQAIKKRIQPRFACREQAERVAWRVLKDWVAVQMTLIQAGLVTVDEALLPYLVLRSDKTVYQAMKEQRLALPSPNGQDK
jgi:hypothetical protein